MYFMHRIQFGIIKKIRTVLKQCFNANWSPERICHLFNISLSLIFLTEYYLRFNYMNFASGETESYQKEYLFRLMENKANNTI